MEIDGFRNYLQDRGLDGDKISESISTIHNLKGLLKEQSTSQELHCATSDEIDTLVRRMVDNRTNSYDNFVTLARYLYYHKNMEAYLSVLTLLDGSNVMDILHEKLGESIGDELTNEIFTDIEIPPLGTQSYEKMKFTHSIMTRLEEITDNETIEAVLEQVCHGLPKDFRKDERQKYLEAGNLDEYLRKKRAANLEQLRKHRDEGTLFFNQEITDDVLEFIQQRPDILTGERRGNTIYHTKIPYMTKEYLAETDERMKRYYACHCAWARESIKTDEVNIPPTFCYCSAGFTKQSWESALAQPLEVEMVKSILKGDLECSFLIHLPEETS